MVKDKAIETIILVHGTFANPPLAQGHTLTWWQKDSASQFQSKLNNFLKDNGSVARCWAHVDPEFKEFEWSGDNSEHQRREAALKFQNYLSQLEKDHRIHRYHIVCHSLGGYVVSRSLLILAMGQSCSKLGTVVFLGAPFLFSRSDRYVTFKLLPLRVQLLVSTILLGTASLFLWVSLGLIPAATCFFFFLASVILTGASYAFKRVKYPECKLVVITSKYDEAIIAIEHLLALTRISLRSFLEDPKMPMLKGFLWLRSSAFRNLTWTNPRRLLGKNFSVISEDVVSWNTLLALINVLGIVGLLAITIPIILVDRLLGLVLFPFRHYAAPLYRAAILALATRRLAKFGLGDDLPLDRIESISKLPRELEEKTTKHALPKDIEDELMKGAISDVAQKLAMAYDVGSQIHLPASNVVDVSQTIKDIFTNTRLVHAQYTQNESLIRLIAREISENLHSSSVSG